MSITLNSFQSVKATDGLLRADTKDGAPSLRTFGTGAFGKVSEWTQDPGATANKQLKTDFLHALTQTYGLEFSSKMSEQIGLNDGKPLEARTVVDILKGAEKNTVDVGNGVKLENTRFKTKDEVVTAANRFAGKGFSASGSNLLESVDKTLNTGSFGLLQQVESIERNGSRFTDLVHALSRIREQSKAFLGAAADETVQANFKSLRVETDVIGFDRMKATSKESEIHEERIKQPGYDARKNTPFDESPFTQRFDELTRKQGFDLRDAEVFTTINATTSQFPGRWELPFKELVKAANTGDAKGLQNAAREATKTVAGQMARLESDIAFLSSPKLLKGVSAEARTALREQCENLKQLLGEMKKQDGPVQGLLAFAALAASAPEDASKIVKGEANGFPLSPPPKTAPSPLSLQSPPPPLVVPPPIAKAPVETNASAKNDAPNASVKSTNDADVSAKNDPTTTSTTNASTNASVTNDTNVLVTNDATKGTGKETVDNPSTDATGQAKDSVTTELTAKLSATTQLSTADAIAAQDASRTEPVRTTIRMNGVEVSHSSFADAKDLREAAVAFAKENAGAGGKATATFTDIAAYLADPSKGSIPTEGSASGLMRALAAQPELRERLANLPKDAKLVITVRVTPGPVSPLPTQGSVGASLFLDSSTKTRDVAAAMMRPFDAFPEEWSALFADLTAKVATGTPDEARAAARKALDTTKAHLDEIRQTIEDMKTVADRVPTENQADFVALRAQLIAVEASMNDKTGIFQKGIAYAAVALEDPVAAKTLATA